MATILKTKSIYYNDINLIAQPSSVNSRMEVPKELHRIIVSPMEAVIGETFAIEADKLGLSMCLHRFCTPEKQLELYNKLKNKNNIFVSVGLNDWERVKLFAAAGATNFLIDIANGYIPSLRSAVYKLKELANVKKIMVGNVHTGIGFKNLTNLGLETYIRVGVGGGSPCSTSDMSGINRGQITELMEIAEVKDQLQYTENENFIVADGGIKNGNYICKALGAGADYCILGGYFAKALEAETNVIGDGSYWGGASHKQQERYGGIKRHSEGKVLNIEGELKPLKTLVDDLWGGISSCISYSSYKSVSEFIGNATFEIKENSLAPSNRK